MKVDHLATKPNLMASENLSACLQDAQFALHPDVVEHSVAMPTDM